MTYRTYDKNLLIKMIRNTKLYIATVLKNYLNKDAVNGLLSKKADKTDIPVNVSQLANDKNYITREEVLSMFENAETKQY